MDLASYGQFAQHPDGLFRPGTDDKMIVQFLRHAELVEHQSRLQGRPVYVSKDYVRVQQPGERDFRLSPATEADKMRWPRQWAQYMNQQEQVPDGTPLDMLFPTEPHIVATLKGISVHTVEQLRDLTAEGISRAGMGGQTLVERAKKYLDASSKGAEFHRLEAENAALKDRLAQLEAQVAKLAASDDDEAPRRRRSRE